jgi:hypothetical protein
MSQNPTSKYISGLVCPNCYGTIKESDLICPHCGTDLKAPPAQSVIPPVFPKTQTASDGTGKIKRPTSVTVIAWILIGLNALSVCTISILLTNETSLAVMRQSPIPLGLQFTISYLSLAVTVLAALFMLKGANWSRWLYVIWTSINWVYAFVLSPTKWLQIPSLLFFAVAVFFLFRPAAREYFSPSEKM